MTVRIAVSLVDEQIEHLGVKPLVLIFDLCLDCANVCSGEGFIGLFPPKHGWKTFVVFAIVISERTWLGRL